MRPSSDDSNCTAPVSSLPRPDLATRHCHIPQPWRAPPPPPPGWMIRGEEKLRPNPNEGPATVRSWNRTQPHSHPVLRKPFKQVLVLRKSPCWIGLLVTVTNQPAVLFSQNKSVTNKQPAVFFSQNKPASAISHQRLTALHDWLPRQNSCFFQ
jgi:hypothetical protein